MKCQADPKFPGKRGAYRLLAFSDVRANSQGGATVIGRKPNTGIRKITGSSTTAVANNHHACKHPKAEGWNGVETRGAPAPPDAARLALSSGGEDPVQERNKTGMPGGSGR